MTKLPKTRQELIDMYIKSLEEGNIPWEQMWKTSIPENAISGIKYRGVNNLYLSYIPIKTADRHFAGANIFDIAVSVLDHKLSLWVNSKSRVYLLRII